MPEPTSRTSLELLKEQRSHVLLVLSHPREGQETRFSHWFIGWASEFVTGEEIVLSARPFRQHEFDVTAGRHEPVPFDYLTVIELSLDGAHQAGGLIRRVIDAHAASGHALAPATWLFYPIGEKVGNPMPDAPLLTVAFANSIPGMEAGFTEFYATRHVRHALRIPALASGQCFKRSQFQVPGAIQPNFDAIALYDQVGEPETLAEAFATLPAGTLDFPALDKVRGRFWECTYRAHRTPSLSATQSAESQHG